jgi:hypothetical protein
MYAVGVKIYKEKRPVFELSPAGLFLAPKTAATAP